MKELYTAIGRFEKRSGGVGKQYPMVMLGRQEHVLDVHEMMIWAALNWRVLDRSRIEELYAQRISELDVPAEKDCIVYIERLLYRGLIVKGGGETDADALYDLFGGLYIVPLSCNGFAKVSGFLKMVLSEGIPVRAAARNIFRKPARTDDEKRVMDLVKQQTLTTAELMKCVEEGASDISDDDKLTDALFTDDYTTSDNLVFTAKTFDCMEPILTAVGNLYLRKQILFTKDVSV